jgi:hypothetical protein
VPDSSQNCLFFVKLLLVFFLLLPELVIAMMGCRVKELTLEVTSIRIIFNSKFLSLLVNSAISWLLVFYFLQLGVLYLNRCG